MRWVIEEVRLLRVPGREVFVQKERKFNTLGLNGADPEHTLRTTVYLTDVEYAIKAHLILSSNARPGDNIYKFENMWKSRIKNGQWVEQPRFGLRECTAYLEAIKGEPPSAVNVSENLGLSYFGTDWEGSRNPYYIPMEVAQGVIRYPSWDEVRQHGLCGLPEGLS